jgi:hypothetical protein
MMEKNMMIRVRKRDGEKEIGHKALLKCISVAISVILIILLIRPVLSGYYASISEITEDNLLRASRITGEDARYHYLLGLFYYSHYNKSGIEKAIDRYLLSLTRNPTDAHAWIAIARAYRDSGMLKHAEYAIRKAVYMNKNSPALIWESGVFFLLEDKPVEAAELLKRYIHMVPDDQENVYSLFYSMKAEPVYICDNLLPREQAFYKRYLNFLMTNKLLSESFELWRRLKSFTPGRADYITYCNFLIEAGEVKDALTLWDDFVGKFGVGNDQSQPEAIWNGDFELPIEDGGFDWRIGKADGVRVFLDRDIKRTGYASLSANFDGKHNPGLYIAEQIVPVESGKMYKVIGYIKTENVTTKNGVFLEVAGYRCGPFIKRTESVTGTNLWKNMELEFTAPGNCKAVKIGIGRERSEKFDNKIGGDVWIDSMAITSIKN